MGYEPASRAHHGSCSETSGNIRPEAQSQLGCFKSDEHGRQSALDRLDILDTPKSQAFEAIVTLVKQVLDVPICAISLIDRDRQWFLAERGLNADGTPRDTSFCTYAIQGTVPMAVPDALADPRFAQGALVLGPPYIRSYAGAPLTTADGYNIGTICITDSKPRQFSLHEMAILQNFAQLVLTEIEMRQAFTVDSLTGVLSRAAWMERARNEVERALLNNQALSLLLIDVDRFKQINDRFGHQIGDKVLNHLGSTMRQLVRLQDHIGRFGGEEFIILLPETDYLGAMKFARRVHVSLRAERELPLDDSKVTVSIGATALWPNERALESLFERCDQALYRAKQGGRNRTHGIPVASAEIPDAKAA